MSRFIKTSSGYLNQDHILLIRFGVEKEEGLDLIQMSDGRIVQTQIQDFDWLGPAYAQDERNRRSAMGPAAEPLETGPGMATRTWVTPVTGEPKYDDAAGDLGFGAPRPEDPTRKHDDDEPGTKPA